VITDEERKKYMIDYDDKFMTNSTEDNMDEIHVHVYTAETDVADEHQHLFLGISGPARIEGRSHVHQIRIRTSFIAEDCKGHWHWVEVRTDQAISMPDGSHTHYFADRTSTNNGHYHNFSDVTGLGPTMFVEEDEYITPSKPCKYKYKRPDDEEYN
jgi:hypothetical protein